MWSFLYIEPEGSNYVTNDVFDNLENDLSRFINEHVILIGEFNARVANVLDLAVNDSFNVFDKNLTKIVILPMKIF